VSILTKADLPITGHGTIDLCRCPDCRKAYIHHGLKDEYVPNELLTALVLLEDTIEWGDIVCCDCRGLALGRLYDESRRYHTKQSISLPGRPNLGGAVRERNALKGL